MSKLTIIAPTENETIASDISVENATILVLGYVETHGITDDIDAVYTDDAGTEHSFDFGSEVFN